MECMTQIHLQYEKTWQECLAYVSKCKVPTTILYLVTSHISPMVSSSLKKLLRPTLGHFIFWLFMLPGPLHPALLCTFIVDIKSIQETSLISWLELFILKSPPLPLNLLCPLTSYIFCRNYVRKVISIKCLVHISTESTIMPCLVSLTGA